MRKEGKVTAPGRDASGPETVEMKVDETRCYPFSYAFEDELAALGFSGRLPVPPEGEEKSDGWERRRLQEAYDFVHKKDPPIAALCLSGGGIRSATFNLGVLQGLAGIGLLDKFDYLSTVSGGGYIGSWLSSWNAREMRHKIEEAKAAGGGATSRDERGEGIEEVAAQLKLQFPGGDESPQIRFLRDYSNYLTPRVGLLTMDTWTLLAIYLRNLLVNWLMMVPLAFSALLLPRLFTSLLPEIGDDHRFLLWGFFLGVLGNLCTAMDLPTTAITAKGAEEEDLSRQTRCDVVRKISRSLFLPLLLLSACCFSLYWAGLKLCLLPGWRTLARFTGFGAVMYWTGWIIPSLMYLQRDDRDACSGGDHLHHEEEGQPARQERRKRRRWIFAAFNLVAVASGSAGGVLAYFLSMSAIPAILSSSWFPKAAFATIAVPSMMVVFLLSGVVFILGTNKLTGDDDREWWGRAGARVILAIMVWLLAFLCVIYGPLLVFHPFWDTKVKLNGMATALGFSGVAGLVTALFGKSNKTPASLKGAEQEEGILAKVGLQAGALLFIFLLAIVLSATTTVIIEKWQAATPPTATDLRDYPLPGKQKEQRKPAGTPFGLSPQESAHLGLLWAPGHRMQGRLALLFAAPFAFSLLLGRLVDPNRFSLHATYRARLIRAYLGATRDPEGEGKRKPHPFTGFDQDDNLRMKDLPTRPLHVVNMAWNLVMGKRLGWQERKAMSFTASPLHCGCANVGYRPTRLYGGHRGISLGTAMAVSGAAASPNMGYHSSPLITFVMSVFNVRLGWWMGNPGLDTWKDASPLLGFGPMIRDAFGRTEGESDYIYLSDGGHFENLGLYEMVRRRCRYIVVGDASCDNQGSFEDLGNAIRKIRVDLGIEIDLDLSRLKPQADDKDGNLRKCQSHFAVGKIRYPLVDGGKYEGMILYAKPSLCCELPGDVYHYAREFAEFPHQSTADQWFNESQFESYRKLGKHCIEHLTGTEREKGDRTRTFRSLGDFFDFAERRIRRSEA